jgi:gliding motility-associated-like protein
MKIHQLFHFFVLLLVSANLQAQICDWDTVYYDDFEFTTTEPYIIPGTTYQTAPSTWGAYTGSRGLYLNFVNGLSGGTMVYNRPFKVCPNTDYRVSLYTATRFSGVQCNVKILITDKNNIGIDSFSDLVPYYPNWFHWVSDTINTTTDTIYFKIFTNIPGSAGGNDLALDDLLIEKCNPLYQYAMSSCGGISSINLIDSITNPTGITGTWTGPSSLGGGYLGTFIPGTHLPGTYTYTISGSSNLCADSLAEVQVNIVAQPNIFSQPDTNQCDSFLLGPISGINLSGNQSYFSGPGGTGIQYMPGDVINSTIMMYIYDATSSNPPCFDEDSFMINIFYTPSVTTIGPQIACDSLVLPPISGTNLSGNQAYFTGPGGSGIKYLPGDVITSTTLLYIYDEAAGASKCKDEAFFLITIKDSPNIDPYKDTSVCNVYILPSIMGQNITGNAGYFSGPLGTGTKFLPGYKVTTTMTFYVYDVSSFNPYCYDQDSFTVTVLPSPVIDDLPDTVVCDYFILPAITGLNLSGNQAYYTAPNGNGTKYLPGDTILTSMQLFIYDLSMANQTCFDEQSFWVLIKQSPQFSNIRDTIVCGQFVLPPLTGINLSGNQAYYSQSGGGGNSMQPGTVLSLSQMVYVFDFNSLNPYCFAEDSFMVNILPPPVISPLQDTTVCDTFVLPVIAGSNLSGNQAYYTGPNGTGANFLPGQAIVTSTKLYVYDLLSGNPPCDDQDSFNITIIPAPLIFAVNDTIVCNQFVLPSIQGSNLTGNQGYYSGPNGSGNQLSVGGIIQSSTLIYIYDPGMPGMNCNGETSFRVTVQNTPVLDTINDTTVCDNFILQAISGLNVTVNAAYYTGPFGMGIKYLPGQSITQSTLLYVYNEIGGNPPCFDQTSFRVTIYASPKLTVYKDTSVCDSFVLIPITGQYLSGNQGYYSGPNGTGISYLPGQVITSTVLIYVYDKNPNYNNCFNEYSFRVTVQPPPQLDSIQDSTVCDQYVLPPIQGLNLTGNQAYYTMQNGNGIKYLAGQMISQSQFLFVYDQAGGNTPCFDETGFMVTILPTPKIDSTSDKTVCNYYVLPVITGSNLSGNQAYFTGSLGIGIRHQTGDTISTTTQLYIYDTLGSNPVCFDEVGFMVNVIPTPVLLSVSDTSVCDAFILPPIKGTNLSGNQKYFTGTFGTGNSFLPSQAITQSGVIYVYDETATNPNCYDQQSFNITIFPAPKLDSILDTVICDQFVLPSISGSNLSGNQAYYSGTGQLGTKFLPGQIITNSQTIFVYDEINAGQPCSDEIQFRVTIVKTPILFEIRDTISCDRFVLPIISGSNLSGSEAYFSGSQGTGTKYLPGQIITSSMQLYVFDQSGPGGLCLDEKAFNIRIDPSPESFDLGMDQNICDGDSIMLQGNSLYAITYSWQDGTTGNVLIVWNAGLYRLTASNNCGSVKDSIYVNVDFCGSCPVFIPNAFTPNNDGVNDLFLINSPCGNIEIDLFVFNRWGEEVYYESSTNPAWDGKHNGQPASMDTYVWQVIYLDQSNRKILSGNVTLIR